MLLLAKAWLFVVFCGCIWLLFVVAPLQLLAIIFIVILSSVASVWSVLYIIDRNGLKKADKISSDIRNRKFLRTEKE